MVKKGILSETEKQWMNGAVPKYSLRDFQQLEQQTITLTTRYSEEV